MTTRTWAVFVDRGAVNPTFNGRAIIEAHKRIQEYWAVNFVQDTQRPQYRYILTNQRRDPSWAAWTSGNSVYFPTSFKYLSFNQLVYVATHEIGHLITPGNRHASDKRNVMFASINDIYKNFHQEDPQWYRFAWKSNRRPWNEPNHWRPVSHYPLPVGLEADYLNTLSGFDKEGAFNIGYQPCEVGCERYSMWDWVKDKFTQRKAFYID